MSEGVHADLTKLHLVCAHLCVRQTIHRFDIRILADPQVNELLPHCTYFNLDKMYILTYLIM